jgi:RNA polymerase sigma-70 factor (ECF subfamily)
VDRLVFDLQPERQFLAMLDEHGPSILALLRRLCRNRDDAEDAFQETAVRVWRSLGNQPRLRNPRGWLLTIAYRTYLDQVKRGRVPVCGQDPADVADRRLLPPAAAAERQEEAEQVREAVASLPEALREVVLLHYTARLSLHETAQAMGLSVGTVKSRLNAALGKLRGLLE